MRLKKCCLFHLFYMQYLTIPLSRRKCPPAFQTCDETDADNVVATDSFPSLESHSIAIFQPLPDKHNNGPQAQDHHNHNHNHTHPRDEMRRDPMLCPNQSFEASPLTIRSPSSASSWFQGFRPKLCMKPVQPPYDLTIWRSAVVSGGSGLVG